MAHTLHTLMNALASKKGKLTQWTKSEIRNSELTCADFKLLVEGRNPPSSWLM